MMTPGRQRKILADMAERLRLDDPELVARFTMFARLHEEEGPPPVEPP
ncbi:hypothetical protein EDD29_6008 [Actinocorallia herbida]|uniref:Uncharacterized protein n=1 Tax=Actinocorallia herbida TaxID=58109 RepID=A0A3N1D479_9ACTN|nr:hypothetical protein EDD29_6008 [Actinocorallia herbida]